MVNPAYASLAVSGVFFINGFMFGSWAPQIPVAQERIGLSAAALGISLLAMAVGALIAMPISGRLIDRWGSAPVLRVSAIAFCGSLLPPVLATSQWMLMLALLVLGATNGAMDVSMNAHGVAVERRAGRPLMSRFHGLFSLGGLVGAGFGGLLLEHVSPAMHAATVTFGLLALAAIFTAWLLPPGVDAGQGSGGGFSLPERRTLMLGVLALLAMLSEGSMLDWSAVYFRSELGSSTGFAAAGFAVFSGAMAAGRFAGDYLRARYGGAMLVRASAALAAAGFAFALFLATPEAAILGFICAGLGLSNLVPLFFGAAGRAGSSAGPAIASVATLGYSGLLAGPPLIGLVAEITGLRISLFIIVGACAVIVACAGAARGQ